MNLCCKDRLFELFLAVSAYIVLSPLLVGIMVCVRLSIGKGVFFKQIRPGLLGKPFAIYKFRTMTNQCDEHGRLLPDSERLTKFGRFLRAASLDELPELFNILKGDMSIVGPRPLLMQYLDRYTPEQARRHEVKPGLTGWAQVNGRNAICWKDKFKLDVWYVDNRSFALNCRIIAMTLKKVLGREGISSDGEATMAEFMGESKGDKRSGAHEPTDRFSGWKVPEIKEGELTQYNWVVQNKNNLKLGYKTDIGAFTYINAKYGVIIEDEVQIGSHCSIYSISTIDRKTGPVVLRKNCRIGTHSTIMPGVTIGENAVVGAHSFVNRDVPANTTVVGVPAKVIK